MKMISNDLRSSCRALLIGEHQGGGTHYDSIFHDIIENSDVVATIPIYGDLKITVNVWETARPEVYGVGKYTYYCSAQQSEDEGYCQNHYYTRANAVHLVFIAWRGETPLYAQSNGNYTTIYQDYTVTDVHGSNDTRFPLEYYAYQTGKEKYIKNSAALASAVDHFEFEFKNWADNVNYFNDNIYPCDSSGNHISLVASFKTKRYKYEAEYPEIEGTTSSDVTKIPTIKLSSSTENSYTLYGGSSFTMFDGSWAQIFSDFNTTDQLIAAHGEIVRAICLANGMDYQMAPLLVPESEESI